MDDWFKQQLNKQLINRQNINQQITRQSIGRKDFSDKLYRDMINQEQNKHRQNQARRQSEQLIEQTVNQRSWGNPAQQQPTPDNALRPATPINKTPQVSKADEGSKGNPGKTLLKEK